MPKCARNGCGQDFEDEQNTDTSCHYHSGGPIFHEGLKSWSCCSDVNKPVLDFESFLAIPGCTVGAHSQNKPRPEPPRSSGPVASQPGPSSLTKTTDDEREFFSSNGLNDSQASPIPVTFTKTMEAMAPAPPGEVEEEEDDTSVPVPANTACQRRGCNAKFVSEEESRGDGDGALCTYHPAPPIFHEGSKGYLCCKRRVLEFEEFMKIKGCKTTKHLFVPKKPKNNIDELVTCRIDHYQTPTQVHVSIFAKQIDKVASVVNFESNKVHIDLKMPSSKRFVRTLNLYGPINSAASNYTVFGTKVELVLAKADTRSWALLEKSNIPTTGHNLTFGVGGRTGTVGAKELILDDNNKTRT